MGELQGSLAKGLGMKVNSFGQTLLTPNSQACLLREGKPAPAGEEPTGWEAAFSQPSLSGSQGCTAPGSWLLLSATPSALRLSLLVLLLVLLLLFLLGGLAVLGGVPRPLACVARGVGAVRVRGLPVSVFLFLLFLERKFKSNVACVYLL